MSSDSELLPYNDELLDDGQLITISLGSLWSSYLAALTEILTYEGIWETGSDRDLAIRQAEDLRARLVEAGGMKRSVHVGGGVEVLATEWRWLNHASVEKRRTYPSYYQSCYAFSNDVDTAAMVAKVPVFLPAGDYDLMIIGSTGVDRAKFKIYADRVGTIIPVSSMYEATPRYMVEWSASFTVSAASIVEFEVWRDPKEVSSTKSFLVFSSMIISPGEI